MADDTNPKNDEGNDEGMSTPKKVMTGAAVGLATAAAVSARSSWATTAPTTSRAPATQAETRAPLVHRLGLEQPFSVGLFVRLFVRHAQALDHWALELRLEAFGLLEQVPLGLRVEPLGLGLEPFWHRLEQVRHRLEQVPLRHEQGPLRLFVEPFGLRLVLEPSAFGLGLLVEQVEIGVVRQSIVVRLFVERPSIGILV